MQHMFLLWARGAHPTVPVLLRQRSSARCIVRVRSDSPRISSNTCGDICPTGPSTGAEDNTKGQPPIAR